MKDYSMHLNPRRLSPAPRSKNLPGGSKGVRKLIFIVIIFVIFFATGKFILDLLPFDQNSRTEASTVNSKKGKINNPDELIAEIKKITDRQTGTFSVYIYELNSDKGYGMNEKMVFTGASVNKIAILAALYNMASNGEIDLEESVVPQDDDIQNYGTGSIRYDPEGTAYSIRTLGRLMMEKSDNTAAYLLGTVIIGTDKIQQTVEKWGLVQTDMAENKTSNSDMQILLTKMYKGEIASKTLTPEMMGLMIRSDFDDRIPKGLPAGTKIYHKTGDEAGKIHDAAIIDIAPNPYYLGIFSTDMSDEEKTKEMMAEISSLVYGYFND